MRQMLLVIVLLLATPLSAQDYRLKIDEIAKGSSVTYLLSSGGYRTHHFEGPVEGGYEVSIWNGRGKGIDGGLFGVGLFDRDGRLLNFTRSGGKTWNYAPHNCFRVVGTCTFTATPTDGTIYEMGRRLEPVENGFRFENFRITEAGEKITSRGHVTLDEKGMMDVLTVEESSDPNMVSMTRESADYR